MPDAEPDEIEEEAKYMSDYEPDEDGELATIYNVTVYSNGMDQPFYFLGAFISKLHAISQYHSVSYVTCDLSVAC